MSLEQDRLHIPNIGNLLQTTNIRWCKRNRSDAIAMLLHRETIQMSQFQTPHVPRRGHKRKNPLAGDRVVSCRTPAHIQPEPAYCQVKADQNKRYAKQRKYHIQCRITDWPRDAKCHTIQKIENPNQRMLNGMRKKSACR